MKPQRREHGETGCHRRIMAVAVFVVALAGVSCSDPSSSDNGETADPVFGADYLESFIEVRDCRFSSSHPGMIRVLVNNIGGEAYGNGDNPLPQGTIVLKEVFDGQTCDDYDDLGIWSVMRKEAAGFDADDGDWHWQDVLPNRSVENDTKARCIGCHRREECVARDYMCTEE